MLFAQLFSMLPSAIDPLTSVLINSLISNCKDPTEGDKCNVRRTELRRDQPPWNGVNSNFREL